MDLLLIRHGEAETVEHDAAGADPALSPLGRRQADAMAAYLAAKTNATIDAVVASPMKRAAQTAAPLASMLDLDITYDDRLREFDFEQTSYRIIEPTNMTPDEADQLLNGLNNPAFIDRVTDGISDVVKANQGRTVAVACHGGVVMQAVAHLLNAPSLAVSLHVENTAIVRLKIASSGFVSLISFGEAPWLEDLSPGL